MATKELTPLKPGKENPVEPKRSFREKLRYLKENITLEPVLAFYVIPGSLSRLATQNLNLDKACRVNKGFGDKVCDALIAKEGTLYQREELEVQKLVASMEVWKNVLLTAIPSILILFIGAWSDKTGKRKFCILLPIVGDLLMLLSNILNAYFFYELPVQVTMFMEAFFPAITGGWIVTYMGAFSYISDISSEESRTFRVGVANLCLTAGMPIGSALSGVLLRSVGYYGVFGISSLLYFISLVYGLFYIRDPERPIQEKEEKTDQSVWSFLKSFFDIKHVRDTLTVGFKTGPNNRRMKSVLVFATIFFIYAPGYGEATVRYLFTRFRFNWDAVKFSFYSTFYTCIHGLGALISISLFSRRLQLHDSVLGLISTCSHVVGCIAYGLAKSGMDMYIAVLIESFNATSFTALRSISSKLVASKELGKMIALFNLMEIVTSLVAGPLYSWIYMVTLGYDAGIFFYVSIVLTLPGAGIFLCFFIENRKSTAQQKKDLLTAEESRPTETIDISKEITSLSISN